VPGHYITGHSCPHRLTLQVPSTARDPPPKGTWDRCSVHTWGLTPLGWEGSTCCPEFPEGLDGKMQVKHPTVTVPYCHHQHSQPAPRAPHSPRHLTFPWPAAGILIAAGHGKPALVYPGVKFPTTPSSRPQGGHPQILSPQPGFSHGGKAKLVNSWWPGSHSRRKKKEPRSPNLLQGSESSHKTPPLKVSTSFQQCETVDQTFSTRDT
jgi:hypothetical protein